MRSNAHYYLLPLLTNMGLITSDGKPRPLWVILKHDLSEKYIAMPYSPHYVPDEPWFAVEEACVPFSLYSPLLNSPNQSGFDSGELIKSAFSFIRGDVSDMIPGGWKWAEVQSLIGIDPTKLREMEDKFFCLVNNQKGCPGRLLWINFKRKAKAQNFAPRNVKVHVL